LHSAVENINAIHHCQVKKHKLRRAT